MTFLLDQAFQIGTTGVSYFCSSGHRGSSGGNKSIWSIALSEETACFSNSLNENWNFGTFYWGLHLNNSSMEVLGVNRFGEQVKIAMFVDENSDKIYHGYPADYRRKNRDRPHISILQVWRAKGFIEKHMISKIRSGKPCLL